MLFNSLKVITNGRLVPLIIASLSCYNSLTLVSCGKKRKIYLSCLIKCKRCHALFESWALDVFAQLETAMQVVVYLTNCV